MHSSGLSVKNPEELAAAHDSSCREMPGNAEAAQTIALAW